jgi:hypothetical protein
MLDTTDSMQTGRESRITPVAFTAAVYGHLSADHRVKESDRRR